MVDKSKKERGDNRNHLKRKQRLKRKEKRHVKHGLVNNRHEKA